MCESILVTCQDLELRLGMQLLCKRYVPYVPGCMLSEQSRTKPAEMRKSSAFGHH